MGSVTTHTGLLIKPPEIRRKDDGTEYVRLKVEVERREGSDVFWIDCWSRYLVEEARQLRTGETVSIECEIRSYSDREYSRPVFRALALRGG